MIKNNILFKNHILKSVQTEGIVSLLVVLSTPIRCHHAELHQATELIGVSTQAVHHCSNETMMKITFRGKHSRPNLQMNESINTCISVLSIVLNFVLSQLRLLSP